MYITWSTTIVAKLRFRDQSRMSHMFIIATCRFLRIQSSIVVSYQISHPCPIHPNWVDWSEALYDSTQFARYVSTQFARSRISQIDSWHDESTTGETSFCGFNRIESNWQHFQPTLHSPPEDKIREITIYEPSSWLKRGHKLQSIGSIRVDSIKSTTFSTHPQIPDQLYFLSLVQIDFRHVESTEGETIRVDSMEKGSWINFWFVESQIPQTNQL